MRDASAWPDLPYDVWKETCDTIHMYSQVPGKIRLALAPPEPEWQHTALYVNSRGLTTGPIPYGDRTFELQFNFLTHYFEITTSDGPTASFPLEPRTVADFYAEVMASLRGLGIDVAIKPMPQEVPHPIPLDTDTTHDTYEEGEVAKFWTILSRVDSVIREFRAPFAGRQTLVQFFWGTFDLSYTRFSGRPAKPPPGVNMIMRESMDAEEVCFGFWFGDQRFGEPAFYSYTYPKPGDIGQAKIRPDQGAWNEQAGLFIFRYADARAAASPKDAILEFLQSCYEVSARKS